MIYQSFINYKEKLPFQIELKKETIQLTLDGKIFKIKLFDSNHVSLLKSEADSLKAQAAFIRQLFEELIQNQHLNLASEIKSLRIAFNQSPQMQIVVQEQKQVIEKTLVATSKILTSLNSSFESAKAKRPAFIDIQRTTATQTLDYMKKIVDDLKGVFVSECLSVKRHAIENFKHVFTHLVPSAQVLNRLTGEERYLAHYLRNNIDWSGLDQEKVITEILCGAYVMFEDGGQLYEDWKKSLEDKQSRYSSHQSDGFTQYSIQGEVIKELLFSQKIIKNTDGSTSIASWCQCERYSLEVGEFFQHMGTWLLYKIRRKNQGPHGESVHTEHQNPLILRLRKTG